MPDTKDITPRWWAAAGVMIICTIGLGFGVSQSSFGRIMLYFIPFFGLYSWVSVKVERETTLKFFIALAILLRLILVFSLPQLSDDIYRFIWDGNIWLKGGNPFDMLPSAWVSENGQVVNPFDREIFERLNSPDYFTIYPPVNQLVFILSVWLIPKSVFGSALIMKSFLFACELGTIRLLWELLPKFKIERRQMLWYVLNPLIIVEICGNLHFEGAMVFFLLLSLWWLTKQKLVLSALGMALSVASKLLPLMFLPFLIRRLGWKKSLIYFSVVGIALAAMFLPLFSELFIANFRQSLDLYFQKFEFNASLYYLLRWVGFQWKGYNMIADFGPLLAVGVFIGIWIMVFLEKSPRLETLPLMMLWAICLYLFCATTVHPWYVSLPLILCVFTPFRFPVVWSGLIMLTYVNYSYSEYYENLWVVGGEYLAVFLFLGWELRKIRQTFPLEVPTAK